MSELGPIADFTDYVECALDPQGAAAEVARLKALLAERQSDREWATKPANGLPIPWDTEERARRANQISKTFSGGEHVLVYREVTEWREV